MSSSDFEMYPTGCDDVQNQDDDNELKETNDKDTTSVYLTIFIFRGEPDVYYKRHVLSYFESSQDPDFHETVHVQRDDETSPWVLDNDHELRDWPLDPYYIDHVNARSFAVSHGREMDVVAIAKSIPVNDRHQDGDWNCQSFVYEVLAEFVRRRLKTDDWYDRIEAEFMEKLLDGAVG